MTNKRHLPDITEEMANQLKSTENQQELISTFFSSYFNLPEDIKNSFAPSIEITERSFDITPDGIHVGGGSIRFELTPLVD